MGQYFDNNEIEKALAEMQGEKKNPRAEAVFFRLIGLLIEAVFNVYNYDHLADRDELVSFAYYNCFLAAKRYNPSKGYKPYSFFTVVIRRSMHLFIQRNKKNTSLAPLPEGLPTVEYNQDDRDAHARSIIESIQYSMAAEKYPDVAGRLIALLEAGEIHHKSNLTEHTDLDPKRVKSFYRLFKQESTRAAIHAV